MTSRQKPGIVLLQTKLNRPGVTKDIVIRPRLLKLLNSGLEGALTLVVAPAGFGKTTLTSSWIQTLSDGGEGDAPIPAAWLSLDEADGDHDIFICYFIAALRTIFPGACPKTLTLIDARQQPPIDLISNTLSNEIDLLPTRFVMVLDDLHRSRSRGVIDYLVGWLHHWPRRMHLVILSRFNPPLPLATLRARGQLTEIRSRDLRFSAEEAAKYLRGVLKITPNETELSLLQRRLEGWIAGLKMAALSIRVHSDLPALASALLDVDTYIADYLADEVLDQQTPTMQLFLLRTSITEQFCVSLCETLNDGLASDFDARTYLDQLETADLFITAQDNRREWYRFHQLFRDLLRQRLLSVMKPDQVSELHRRAARWFAGHDLIEQAIYHALEAGDLDLVVQFMQQGLCDVLNHEDRPTLERWLRLLPEDIVRQSPELLMMRVWGHALRWDLEQLAAGVERAEALLNGSNGAEQAVLLRGQIAVIKGSSTFGSNQYERAVAYCQEGLALLPEEWRYVRGVGAVYTGMSLYASGRGGEAEKFLSEQYESARDKTDGYALRLLLGLTINSIQAGNYENAERMARAMLRQAVQGRLAVMEGWAHHMIGLVNYEWNELPTAARHFAAVVDLFHTTQWATARNGMIGQALARQAMGRSTDALEAIDRLSRIDLDYHGQEAMDTAAARARLMLMRGDAEGAERWADLDAVRPADQSLLPWMEQPALTRARILIARNMGADAQSAMQILDATGELAERTFNTRIMIEVLALCALAKLAQGDSPGARQSLVKSVELARSGGFIRVFVDLGPQMQKLLHQIAGHGSITKSVARILDAFPETNGTGSKVTSIIVKGKETLVHDPPFPEYGLEERLTSRELEVLTLMSEPISLKEIADRLCISYATAKRYTINIYNKLDVHSRWDAITAAVQLGILPPRQ